MGACTPQVDLGREYTEPIDILDASGAVQARGWARTPLFGFDRDRVDPDAIREWDFYAINAPDFAINVTLARIPVNGTPLVLASVKVYDFVLGEMIGPDLFTVDTDDALVFDPDPDGSYALAAGAGTLTYAMDGATRVITFAPAEGDGGGGDGGTLRIGPRPAESLALVTPYDEPGRFFYEDKVLGMTAEGSLSVGGRTYVVPDGALATLDFVRADAPATMTWDWATAVGRVDDRVVCVNLGSVYGDEAGGTPDAVLVDGVLHKLGRVDWAWDQADPSAPWRMTSADGTVDLTLTGDDVEVNDTTIGAYHVQLWKLYGTWSGTVEPPDGDPIMIDGLLGGAEHLQAAW